MEQTRPLRVVFDANVWVSATNFPGSVPDRAVELSRRRVVRSIISEEIIQQVQGALRGPNFALPARVARRAEIGIRRASIIVAPTVRLAVITAKESDNRVLECAVEGGVDLIVTGDRKHLLPLGAYQGIPIVTPADFLRTVTPP